MLDLHLQTAHMLQLTSTSATEHVTALACVWAQAELGSQQT